MANPQQTDLGLGGEQKWPGPVTDQVTVGDELAFEALPEATRMLAERVMRERMHSEFDDSEVDYEAGFDVGKAEGEKAQKNINEQLRKQLDEVTAKNTELSSRILEEQRQRQLAEGRTREAEKACDRLRKQLEAATKRVAS